MSDQEKEKAFRQTLDQRTREADERRKRNLSVSRDERSSRAIERLVPKYLEHYEQQGVRRTEEQVRRELAQRAERVRRKKDGE